MKPVFDDTSPTADDDAFFTALPIAQSFVEAQIRALAAKDIVIEAISKSGKPPILEVPIGMPYRSALDQAGADHILFVIHPRGDAWTLNGIKQQMIPLTNPPICQPLGLV